MFYWLHYAITYYNSTSQYNQNRPLRFLPSERRFQCLYQVLCIALFRDDIGGQSTFREGICRYLPDCAVTTDLIAGFSGETEKEHEATLSLMREVGYEFAYMFKYSERPGTFAHEHLPDDVPDEVKSRRLSEIIALQNELGHASNLRDVGREFEVLVEGRSKRDEKQLSGRTSQNKVVVFDRGRHDVGDYVRVRITGCTPATLFGEEII